MQTDKEMEAFVESEKPQRIVRAFNKECAIREDVAERDRLNRCKNKENIGLKICSPFDLGGHKTGVLNAVQKAASHTMKKCIHDRAIKVEGGRRAEIITRRCSEVGLNHVLQQDGELAVIVNGTIACAGKLRLDDPMWLGRCGGNDEVASLRVVYFVN